MSEQVALSERHARAAQRQQVGARLDALGDQRRADVVRERHERSHQRFTAAVLTDTADEMRVELDDLGAQLEHVPEAREPGAGIIDSEPEAAGAQTTDDADE